MGTPPPSNASVPTPVGRTFYFSATRAFAEQKPTVIALAVITLLALLCRVHALTESLWIDELHTSWCLQDSLWQVFPRAAEGNQGPIYFVAQWLWIACVGESEFTLRFPSLVAGLLTPAAVYWCVQKLDFGEHSVRLGLLAAALSATDDYAIFYSQETRPYAWVILLSILHFTHVIVWQRSPTRAATWGISLGCVLLFYLHYTTVLLFLAEAVCVLAGWLWQRAKSQFNLRELLLLTAIVGMSLAPAFPQLRQLADRSPNWKQFVEIPTLANLVWIFPGAIGLIGVLVVPVIQRLQGRAGEKTRLPANFIIAVWLVVPLVVAWVSTRFDFARLFFPRYLLFALPASWILPALAIHFVRDLREWSVGAALLLTCWVYYQTPVREIWQPPADGVRGEDWRGAIKWLNEENAEMHHNVIINSGMIESSRQSITELHRSSIASDSYLKLPVIGLYRLSLVDQQIHLVPRHERAAFWTITRGRDRDMFFLRGKDRMFGRQKRIEFGSVVVSHYE